MRRKTNLTDRIRTFLSERVKRKLPTTVKDLIGDGVSLADIERADKQGVVTLLRNKDGSQNHLVASSVIEPAVWGECSAAASQPRQKPKRTPDGRLYYWRNDKDNVQPFAVRVESDGSSCIVLTTQQRDPVVKTAACWTQKHSYPADRFREALRDACDANTGAGEGLFSGRPPWRHPLADYPLDKRKP